MRPVKAHREAAARGGPEAAHDPYPVEDDGVSAFLTQCLLGLSRRQKSLPCKWLYDDRGSALFEQICTTPEYYVSRTEMWLLKHAAAWLADALAHPTALIEFGSGAGRKTRLLLDATSAITRYVPIDIGEAELARACRGIAADYPQLAVHPLLGDFTHGIELSDTVQGEERLGVFLGSTLGNFTPVDAVAFLSEARRMLGLGGRLLLGIDVLKDEPTLLSAYDDSEGMTAAFNLNLLARMNRELGCDIDLTSFRHRAEWQRHRSRVEMHFVSLRRQSFDLAGRTFAFEKGETIHTENSYKLSREAMDTIVLIAGWRVERRWANEAPAYDLLLLQSG